MKASSVVALALVAALVSSRRLGADRGGQRHVLAPAPTYYVAVEVHDCKPSSLEFRGATNLPVGAIMTVTVDDFDGDGWKRFSDWLYVSVKESGFFEGTIAPLKGSEFRHNLVVNVSFYTNLGKQPDHVLKVIGQKGEYLAGVENPSSHLDELAGLTKNPQLHQSSGWYYGLETIARVPACGK